MYTENLGNFNNHRQLIKLPDPLFDKIELAFHVFENRKTIKTISDKKLSLQIISNLLWAACGINRKKSFSEASGRNAKVIPRIDNVRVDKVALSFHPWLRA